MSGEIICVGMVVRGFNSKIRNGSFQLEILVKEESAEPSIKLRRARIQWEQELTDGNYLPPKIRIGERVQVYYNPRDNEILRVCNGNKTYIDCITNEDLKYLPN